MPITARTKFVRVPGYEGTEGRDVRLLTPDEIEDILTVFTPSIGGTKEIRDLNLEYQKDFVRQTIANYPISPDAFPLVKEEIKRQYEAAKVLPGKPVGIRCAEAFIATVMQATLNTRHKAGSGIDVGFDAVREVIFLPARRKRELVFLHFKERKTREEILDYRSEIVYRNVWHFVDDYDIDTQDHFPDDWWNPFQRRMMGIDEENLAERPIMRLYLNVVMMAEYKTSMRDLAVAITRGNNSDRVKCVFGPVESGILDIYPTEEALSEMEARGGSDELKYVYFLDQNVKPALATNFAIVKGHEDIEALYYSFTPVMSALTFCRYVSDRRGPNDEHIYYVKKRKEVLMFQGVTSKDVSDVLEQIDGEIIEDNPDHYILQFRNETNGQTPENLFKEALKEQSQILKYQRDEWKRKKEEDEDFDEDEPPEEPLIAQLNKHNFAILYSVNLAKPLSLPGVDRSRTYSNNFHEMTRVLGSECARAYHLYNTYQVMTATKTSINPRYFQFFSDVVFHRGSPTGITFAGISKQTGGWLTRAAIEQSSKILSEAALYDKSGESTRNIAVALTVGNLAKVGTGSSKYGVDFDEVDPSLILDDPTEEGVEFDPNKIVNEAYDKIRHDTTDVILDRAEGDNNIEDGSAFNKSYKTPDFFNVRKTVGNPNEAKEGTSLSKIRRIIDSRDYVRPDTQSTPSIIKPSDIDALVNDPMQDIPMVVRTILGLSVPNRRIRLTKTVWIEQQLVVDRINVNDFMEVAKILTH